MKTLSGDTWHVQYFFTKPLRCAVKKHLRSIYSVFKLFLMCCGRLGAVRWQVYK